MSQNHFIYYNIRKKMWSVLNSDMKLVAHTNEIYLKNVKFIVRQGGRQRVLKEKRKNVHAFIKGEIITKEEFDKGDVFGYSVVTYNPYLYSTFVHQGNKLPVRGGSYACLIDHMLFVKGIEYGPKKALDKPQTRGNMRE